MAHYRHQQGLPAVSINWGAWAEVGMAAALDAPSRERWAAQGINFIASDEGARVLEQVLLQGKAQVAVLPMDWAKLGQQLAQGEEPPFLRQLVGHSEAPGPMQKEAAAEPQFLLQLEACAPEERYQLLLNHVQGQVTVVLGLDPNQAINPVLSLTDMGMDSLMAVELKNRIESNLGVNISISFFLEGATIADLVKVLLEKIQNGWTGQGASPKVIVQSGQNGLASEVADAERAKLLLANLDQLSEDEMDALLSNLLVENEVNSDSIGG
jgi:acyl carrier protein